MSEIENILDELKRVHNGDAWHGPALHELLSGVTAEQAARHPISDAHSIWELVLHIAAWENVFRRRLEGISVNEPEEGDFPQVGEETQGAWEQTLAGLESAHEQLLKAIAALPDSGLGETVTGKDYSIRFMLRGIVRHHVYHAGQIGLLKKNIA